MNLFNRTCENERCSIHTTCKRQVSNCTTKREERDREIFASNSLQETVSERVGKRWSTQVTRHRETERNPCSTQLARNTHTHTHRASNLQETERDREGEREREKFLQHTPHSACTGLGTLPLFLWNRPSGWWLGVSNAIAAGMMLSASFSLVSEGIKLQPDGASIWGYQVCMCDVCMYVFAYACMFDFYVVVYPWSA